LIHPGASRTFQLSAVAAGLLVWAYVIARALMVPLTHDEAATFFHYVLPQNMWPGEAHWDANNHILNSLLTLGSTRLLGDTIFALRLPGLLFFGVYLFFTYRLSRYTTSTRQRIMLLCGLWGTHMILEFFGYCRGYGISLALLAGAIYFLFRLVKDPAWWYGPMALLLALLATSANLTLLPIFLMIAALWVVALLSNAEARPRNKRVVGWTTIGISAAAFGYGFLYLADFADGLYERQLLYYGAVHFVRGSIGSLFICTTGFGHNAIYWAIAGIGGVFMAITLIRFLRAPLKAMADPSWLGAALFTGAVAAALAIHFLKDTPYPLDRTGLHLLFLFLLAAGMFSAKSAVIWYVMNGLCVLFLVVSVDMISLNSMSVWEGEHTESAIYDAFTDAEPEVQQEIPIVSGYHMRRLIWSWCVRKGHKKSSIVHLDDYPSPYADYLIAYPWDMSDSGIDTNRYQNLYQSPVSFVTLYRRKERLKRVALADSSYAVEHVYNEFYNLYNLPARHLQGKVVAFTISGDFRVDRGSEYQVVAAAVDSNGAALAYSDMPLKWLYQPQQGKQSVQNILYLGRLSEEVSTIKFYIWNIRRHVLEISNLKASLIELSE
jgi:hypothetical protein